MSRKARVLFIDDEQRVLNSMRGMFRRKFELFLATDGRSALNIAAQNPIDVVVADQRMPGMSGTEVLGRVKELSPNTIRILLTGYADPTAVENSINVGEVFRFLAKPCPPKVLRDTLDVAIRAARATQQTLPVVTHRIDAHIGNRDVSPTPVSRAELPELRPYVRSTSNSVRTDNKQPTVLAKDVGVILYTVDAQFAESAIRAVSSERSTTLATSLITVMRYLEKQSSGVLVTDVTSNDTRLQGIIAALKRYVPDLVTIVVSNNSDTTDMINLINCGQIYRFLRKPVTQLQLRAEIGAAAAKHRALRDNEVLIERHSVTQLPAQFDMSATQINSLTKMHEIRSQRLSAHGGF